MGDRSYLVQTDEGNMYRRNTKFIRTVPYMTDELDSADQPFTASAPVTNVETTEPLHTGLEGVRNQVLLERRQEKEYLKSFSADSS